MKFISFFTFMKLQFLIIFMRMLVFLNLTDSIIFMVHIKLFTNNFTQLVFSLCFADDFRVILVIVFQIILDTINR